MNNLTSTSNNTISTKKHSFFGVSILRVIAMFGVFLVHFGQRFNLQGTLRAISDFGMHGVELFFIISGFLMLQSLDKCNSWKDVFRFYIKKAIRLLVLYYLVILWYFISETFIFKDIVSDPYSLGWLRYLFLLNGIVPADTYLWSNVGITWTIPLFAMAYLITPLLYKYLKINSTIKLGSFFIVSFIISYLSNKYFHGWCSFLNYYYIFVGGMLIYKAVLENKAQIVNIGMLILIVGLLIIPFSYLLQITLLFMLLLSISYNFSLNNKYFNKIISTIDTYSYTVYLGHGIIFCSIIDKFYLPPIPRLAVAILGTAILCLILYHFYERPLTKLLNKKLLPKKSNSIHSSNDTSIKQ